MESSEASAASTAIPDPQSQLSPTPSSKGKSPNHPRGKAPSRRGFALKRFRNNTAAASSSTASDNEAPSNSLNPPINQARSVSPMPSTESGPIKPEKATASTDDSTKPDIDPWLNRKSQSPFTEYDLEELLRSRSLRRVTGRIQDDNKTAADVDKLPERCLTEEVSQNMWERSKGTVGVIEKLQRHFSVMKEKLYRARCLGMDQGIEAVQKGDSPFLEQHLARIRQTRQDEMDKAKSLQEARKASIEIEYDSAVTALWESMDLELARRMKLARHRQVDELIRNESDFMYNQLRHVFAKLKEDANRGLPVSQIINGILVDATTETNLDDCMTDLWKMMKASIKERHWNEYLCPAAEMRLEEGESLLRQKVMRQAVLQGGKPSGTSNRRKGSGDSEKGQKKRPKTAATEQTAKENTSSVESGLNSIVEDDQEESLPVESTPADSALPSGSTGVSAVA